MKNIAFSEEITLEAHNLKNDGNLNNKPYKKILINSTIIIFIQSVCLDVQISSPSKHPCNDKK